MNDLYNNKICFLNIKERSFTLFASILITFLIGFLYIVSTKYCYESITITAYAECEDTCLLHASIPSNIEIAKISINNQTQEFVIKEQELYNDMDYYTSYYNYTLEFTDLDAKNEFVEVTVYYNKQRIIKKIIDLVF